MEKILSNDKYIGVMRFGDIVNDHDFPPIVDKATFEAAAQKRKANGRKPYDMSHHEEYLLVGKIFCGKCGSTVASEASLKRNGTYYRWYKCSNRKKRNKCDLPIFNKKALEDLVVNDAISLIDQGILDRVVDDVMKAQDEESPERKALKKQMIDVDRRLNNLLKAIEDGMVFETTKDRMSELETQKSALMKSLAQLDLEKQTFTREPVEFYLDQFNILNPNNEEDRKKIIGLFVNSVYLYPDNEVEIAYNWGGPRHRFKASEIPKEMKSSNLDRFAPPLR